MKKNQPDDPVLRVCVDVVLFQSSQQFVVHTEGQSRFQTSNESVSIGVRKRRFGQLKKSFSFTSSAFENDKQLRRFSSLNILYKRGCWIIRTIEKNLNNLEDIT